MIKKNDVKRADKGNAKCNCVNCKCGKNNKITRNMKINEIIQKHPEVIPILAGYGLQCVGCHYSSLDTLESGAKTHGMPEELIDMIVKDANVIANSNN